MHAEPLAEHSLSVLAPVLAPVLDPVLAPVLPPVLAHCVEPRLCSVSVYGMGSPKGTVGTPAETHDLLLAREHVNFMEVQRPALIAQPVQQAKH